MSSTLPRIVDTGPPTTLWSRPARSVRPIAHSFPGFESDVPGRGIALAPLLPERWGRLVLADLRLGPATITIEAVGSSGRVTGLPADGTLIERSVGHR
ncbi:hypothetical protein [Nocardia sp. NPDC051570]|uniref:hypothetical protein n=1 Tax=Nocardia sp. NPDC051570 TaxID=3364324 RepID=UPI0037BAE48F